MIEPGIREYLKQIHQTFVKGDAREESYYLFLNQLIQAIAEDIKKTGITITINPKKTEGGNPDFRIWDGKSRIVGYIEAKRPEGKDPGSGRYPALYQSRPGPSIDHGISEKD